MYCFLRGKFFHDASDEVCGGFGRSKEVSKVRNGAATKDVALTKSGEITVGKFVDRERSDYRDLMHDQLLDTLGDDYVEAEEIGRAHV